jgi:hypothetical protein
MASWQDEGHFVPPVFERAPQEGEPDYHITWTWNGWEAPFVVEHRWTHEDSSSLVQAQRGRTHR